MKGLFRKLASGVAAVGRAIGGIAKGVVRRVWNSYPMRAARHFASWVAGDNRPAMVMEQAEEVAEEAVGQDYDPVADATEDMQNSNEPYLVQDYARAQTHEAREEFAKQMRPKTREWVQKLDTNHMFQITSMRPDQIRGHLAGTAQIEGLPSVRQEIARSTQADVDRAIRQARELVRQERRQERKAARDPMTEAAFRVDTNAHQVKQGYARIANDATPMTRRSAASPEDRAAMRVQQREQRQERREASQRAYANAPRPSGMAFA